MQKKYRWLLRILLVALLIGGFYYFFIYFPIYIEFNAQEQSDFGWSQKDEDRFYCESIIPIRGTPYIFCRFHDNGYPQSSGRWNYGYTTLLYRGFLIDNSRSLSVLNGEWTSKYYVESGLVMDGETWFHKKSFSINREPILQFLHSTTKLPIYASLPLLPHDFRNLCKKSEHEYMLVDIAGNIESKKEIPEHFFPIAGENKIVVPNMHNRIFEDGMKEYSYGEDKLNLLNEWKTGKYLYNLITLDDGCYFSFEDQEQKKLYCFTTGSSPKTISFDLNNLYDILPDLQMGKYLHVSSCDQHGDCSSCFYLQEGGWDRCPVVKINSSRIKDGGFNDIFKFCGSIPKEKDKWSTILALNNDQFIISFCPEFDINNKQFISPSFDIYKPSIIENGDNNRFCEKIKTVDIPFKVDSREISTLDDQYILFYGKGAIWKMKWDGSEYAKVFPK